MVTPFRFFGFVAVEADDRKTKIMERQNLILRNPPGQINKAFFFNKKVGKEIIKIGPHRVIGCAWRCFCFLEFYGLRKLNCRMLIGLNWLLYWD